jgi:hypothetical protein
MWEGTCTKRMESFSSGNGLQASRCVFKSPGQVLLATDSLILKVSLVPHPTETFEIQSELWNECKHPIESIDVKERISAVIDCRGVVSLFSSKCDSVESKKRRTEGRFITCIDSEGVQEFGWYGISMECEERFATASSVTRNLQIFDTESSRVLWKTRARSCPGAISWATIPQSSHPVLFSNESGAICVWDVRSSCPIDRIQLEDPGDFYAMDCRNGKCVVGGSSRNIRFCDVRNLKNWIQVSASMKYDVRLYSRFQCDSPLRSRKSSSGKRISASLPA